MHLSVQAKDVIRATFNHVVCAPEQLSQIAAVLCCLYNYVVIVKPYDVLQRFEINCNTKPPKLCATMHSLMDQKCLLP